MVRRMTSSNGDDLMADGRIKTLPNQARQIIGETFRFCLPALVLGLVLRVLMLWHMPYGYMQFDSADFLVTANALLTKGTLSIHAKRTFLVPVLYAIPFLLHLPALIVIPIAQHMLGVAQVLAVGFLVRLWFLSWRWVIVPITLMFAANPVLLWFEHALMSESVYLFCVLSLALSATLYVNCPNGKRFAWLLAALFWVTAARPEGRLFFLFVFGLLVLLHGRDRKRLASRFAWLAGLAMVVLPITRTHQAGELLYASVLPFAPDESRVDPEFGRRVLPLKAAAMGHAKGASLELQSLAQNLDKMSEEYLKEKGQANPDNDALCQKLAIEACLHQPWALPRLAFTKFRYALRGATSVGYSEPRLQEKLEVGFRRKGLLKTLSVGLVGRPLSNDEAIDDFIRANYRPFSWYPWLDLVWRRCTAGIWRGPASELPSLPVFFLLALAGMAVAALTPGRYRALHASWVLTLLTLWFAVLLTGVDNPRYRFLFEPFCFIYIFLGAATALGLAGEWYKSRQAGVPLANTMEVEDTPSANSRRVGV